MNFIKLFPNVIFAVTKKTRMPVLVEASDELVKLLDGDLFEDNCPIDTLYDRFPKKQGIYRCDIEYYFEQGYYEGEKADGESSWDFRPVNIIKISVGVLENDNS